MVFICFNFVVGYLYICFNSASLEKKATGVLKLSSYCERITKAGNAVMKWIPTVTFENTFMQLLAAFGNRFTTALADFYK